jgi:hypothetical protein
VKPQPGGLEKNYDDIGARSTVDLHTDYLNIPKHVLDKTPKKTPQGVDATSQPSKSSRGNGATVKDRRKPAEDYRGAAAGQHSRA